MGLLLPAIVALVMQLAQMLPLPVAVRIALPSYTFMAWNGLFTSPAQLGPLMIGIVVSLVWAVAAAALAYLLFVKRDFTNLTSDGSGRRAITAGLLPLVVLFGITVAAITPASGATGSGIDQEKVQQSVATAFAHLYRLQAKQLNRPDVTEEQLKTSAACTKGGGQLAARGAGNDWRCVVSWHLPDVAAMRLGDLPTRHHSWRAVRRRRRRTEGSERLLPGEDPDRGRTQPAVAVRRQCRTAVRHLEGIVPCR